MTYVRQALGIEFPTLAEAQAKMAALSSKSEQQKMAMGPALEPPEPPAPPEPPPLFFRPPSVTERIDKVVEEKIYVPPPPPKPPSIGQMCRDMGITDRSLLLECRRMIRSGSSLEEVQAALVGENEKNGENGEKAGPNWLLIGGIAGAAVLGLFLFGGRR